MSRPPSTPHRPLPRMKQPHQLAISYSSPKLQPHIAFTASFEASPLSDHRPSNRPFINSPTTYLMAISLTKKLVATNRSPFSPEA
ncbi:unnamed protein product [Dovyalis caffra]|uniref:Uncharacterized protein n=1 Tax=Dovyalis caffra TaxID=77055 RepID=A0AAV1RF48_9ROSI|nr:unnamed protein product [Dovyalis caffra]